MSSANISKMLLAIQAEVDETQIHHRILRQLVFKDMNSRANQIHQAAQYTYTWILEDGPVNQNDQRLHAWQIFLNWLRTGDNILHVSGNPGSGKSTLMKFLIQHDRTKRELMVWAGANTLVFCVFYFWNSGSEAQRTLSGLYRSLLFQSLSQCPELIKEVFPRQFRKMRAFTGDTMVEEIQSFDEDHIKEAFNLFLDRACQGGFRLCFFIDGLDECEGNRLQHENLVLMLQRWTDSGAIKLCVSSRPYSEFIEPLDIPENQLVQLHEVNECDIRAYCLERFENDVHARKRGRLCEDLAEAVVRQAQGVFLWVYLVVDILLIGLRQADPDSVLRAQLNSLPRDLDQLYTKLREPIEADDIQRVRSNRMLLLAARNPRDSSLKAIAFSWLEEQECDEGGLVDPDFPQPSRIKPYSEEEVFKRVQNVTRQIDGLARGFLQVTSGPRNDTTSNGEVPSFFDATVQFCHRTARDYLLHNKHRHHSLLDSFPNFERSGVYARIILAELIHGYQSKVPPLHNIFSRGDGDRLFLGEIDPDLAGRFELPVQDLVPPFATRLLSGAQHIPSSLDHRLAQVSFTEYAAFCGLDQYVIRKVATDAIKLNGTTSCGSVLLAVLPKWRFNLVPEILRWSRGKKQLCVVWDEHGNVQSLTPACVLAVTEILRRVFGKEELLRFSTPPNISEIELKRGKELLRFSIGMKISMRITIRGIKKKHGEETSDELEDLRVQINITEALDVLEKIHEDITRLERPQGVYSETMGVRYTGTKMLENISTARLGRVVDKEADTTEYGLKEWPDQLHPFFSHGTEDFKFQMFVEKVEWALDSQDFVELDGWMRLY